MPDRPAPLDLARLRRLCDAQNPCPACGEFSRDGLPCRICWRHTTQRIAELPWLWHELELTRYRLDRLHEHTGGRSAETGLPWNDNASKTARRITDGVNERNGLAGWVRVTVEDLGARRPRDTVPAMSAHLLAWLKPLRRHEAAADLVADVWGWTDAMLQAINRPEYRKVKAGPCPNSFDDAPCLGTVHLVIAAEGADGPTFARCEPDDGRTAMVCGEVWEAHQLSRLGRRIREREATIAAQAARAREVLA